MAVKIFNNETEISQYFNKVCSKAVEAVSEKLLKDFQNHLNKTIYAAKPGEYQRYHNNGGFYSGWIIKTEKFSGQIGKYVKSLVFDGNKLINYQSDDRNGNIAHGGRGYEDIRSLMPDILNDRVVNDYLSVAGGAKYLFGSGKGYWDTYLVDLDKKVIKWFNEELGKYGIKRG